MASDMNVTENQVDEQTAHGRKYKGTGQLTDNQGDGDKPWEDAEKSRDLFPSSAYHLAH